MLKKSVIILLILALAYTAHAQYTCVKAHRFDVPSFTITTQTYQQYVYQQFETTTNYTHLVLLSSFNVDGAGTPSNNEVWVKVKIDGNQLVEERLRVVRAATDKGSTGTRPLEFNVAQGTHTITMEFKHTEPNNVNVNDFDMSILQNQSTAGYTIREQIINRSNSFVSTTYISIFNWTVTKTVSSPTFITAKETVTSSNAFTEVDFFLRNVDDNHTSPITSRRLEAIGDVGSIAETWIEIDDHPTHNYSKYGLSTQPTATISVNTSLLDFDLKDYNTNIIDNFQLTDNATNRTSTKTYSAGNNSMLNHTFTARCPAIMLTMSSSFKSNSGPQTPRYYILGKNSTGGNLSRADCYSNKERDLSSTTDIGNAFIYFICKNLTIGQNYTVELWNEVPAGEQVIQFDESFNGFQVNNNYFNILTVVPEFNITTIILALMLGTLIIFTLRKTR